MPITKRVLGKTLYLIVVFCCAHFLGGVCLANDRDWPEYDARFVELMKKGKFFEALEFARSIHSMAVRKTGPGSKAAIKALHNLGAAQCRLGRYREAAENLERELAALRKADADGNRDMSLCLFGLARAYSELGRNKDAKELFREVIENLHKEVESVQARAGDSDPKCTSLLIWLADCYQWLGKDRETENHLKRALRIKEESGQANDKEYSDILYGLGTVAWMRGHNRKATDLYTKALEVRRQTLGKHHPDTGTCLYQLAGVCLDMRRFDSSARLFTEFIESSQETLGPSHPTISEALYGLGLSSLKTGNCDRAEKSFERMLRILREPKSQRGHYRMAAVLVKLGESRLLRENYEETLEFSNKALTILKDIGAPDDEVKADALHNLGAARNALGEYKQAVSPLEQALSIRVERLGKSLPETVATAKNLNKAYTALRYTDKLEHLEAQFGKLISSDSNDRKDKQQEDMGPVKGKE